MSLILDGTNGETFPSWTTAGRPSPAAPGQTGYNTTLNVLETYNGTTWDFSSVAAPTTTGNVLFTTNGTSWSSTPKMTFGTLNGGGTTPFPGVGGPLVVDFTGIPSWAKRITIVYNAVSLSGTASHLVQIGSGSFAGSTYSSVGAAAGATVVTSTSGYAIFENTASRALSGAMTLVNISGNNWIESHSAMSGNEGRYGGGTGTSAGILDRIRLTTTGTDTFDAGSVNIMYE